MVYISFIVVIMAVKCVLRDGTRTGSWRRAFILSPSPSTIVEPAATTGDQHPGKAAPSVPDLLTPRPSPGPHLSRSLLLRLGLPPQTRENKLSKAPAAAVGAPGVPNPGGD
ncbi:unnamed protein product [Arctogadus glacialis]